MASNFLCLNDNKTEVLVIGSRHKIKSLGSISLKIGDENIRFTPEARNIGVIFDNHRSMQHVDLHGLASVTFQPSRPT